MLPLHTFRRLHEQHVTWGELSQYQWQELNDMISDPLNAQFECFNSIDAITIHIGEVEAECTTFAQCDGVVIVQNSSAAAQCTVSGYVSGFAIERLYEDVMMDYLPRYYQSSEVMKRLIEISGEELRRGDIFVDSVLEQSIPQSATFAITRWEEDLNIPENHAASLEQRRFEVINRLNAPNKTNIDTVRRIAAGYFKKLQKVEVKPDGLHITIRRNIENTEEFERVIRRYIPANMMIHYKVTSVTWGEIESVPLIWAQVNQMKWRQLEAIQL
jgi:uncharacterized protein YmfQ (DUF2313 family)